MTPWTSLPLSCCCLLLLQSAAVSASASVDRKALYRQAVVENYGDSIPYEPCLIPGEPTIRVEKAPENSIRIFAGIDIMASVDDVWNLLTDYGNLQNVIPNLVVNEVMALFDASQGDLYVDCSQPEDVQCQQIADQMKGALLRQVGGAKVAGISFSARTKLEVREWPQGMPDFAHFNGEVWKGQSRKDRAKDYAKIKLERNRFPRPFAVSSLPTRDISMQVRRDERWAPRCRIHPTRLVEVFLVLYPNKQI
jgi:hypothetical protein